MPLARDLMKEYRVVTWECRGVPNLSGELSKANAGLDIHMGDLNAILETLSVVEPVHVVGWCSGTSVAHRFARVFPDKVASLSLLNGAYFLEGVATTKFQETVRLMMPRIANNASLSAFFFKLLFQRRGSGMEEQQTQVNHLLDGIHPAVLHMTSLPFQSARSLYRYALLINATFEDPEERFVGAVERPTLLVAGKKDQVAHYEGSTAVAKRSPGAQIYVSESGDHYSFYFDNQIRKEIVSFIGDVSFQ
jgi:pimeloyl-ACP methyl ester carboxylesterase